MRGVIIIILLWLLPLSMGQVVQPTWLMRPDQLPNAQAAEVRVTPEKLKQAADIRASIQKAVNEGTYVVASSPDQFVTALGQQQPVVMGWPAMFKLPNNTNWPPPRFSFG